MRNTSIIGRIALPVSKANKNLPPSVWKKMTRSQQEAHKVNTSITGRIALRVSKANKSLPPSVWKKMTRSQQEAHKVKQLMYKIRKVYRKSKLVANKVTRSLGLAQNLRIAVKPPTRIKKVRKVKKQLRCIIRGYLSTRAAVRTYGLPKIGRKAVLRKVNRPSTKFKRLLKRTPRPILALHSSYRSGLYSAVEIDHTLLLPTLSENYTVARYTKTGAKWQALRKQQAIPGSTLLKASKNIVKDRGYIKHIVRMRYRWFFNPKLTQFKLFKKNFKRSLKRYKKISKNKLFVRKFSAHLPKLTGFTSRGLLDLWLPFRRNYNQYWSATNAVAKFSQTLLMGVASLLTSLRLSPSLSAGRYVIKSGAITVNGETARPLTVLKPGDIMQINVNIWKAIRSFFSYQKWNSNMSYLQQVAFLQADWASLMFMMVRWPNKHELLAPSFLSERWVRYYIRQFPSKISKFKQVGGNWKVYKKIIAKH